MALSDKTEVKVPDVIGMTQTQAESSLEEAGLKLGTVYEIDSETVESGKVVKTNPTPGANRKEGSKVDLYISSGSETFDMPDYKGQTYEEAKAELMATYHVPEEKITYEEVKDTEADNGTIVSQTPKAGDSYNLKGTTKIVFGVAAKENISMPNVTTDASGNSMTYSQALAVLTALGISESRIKLYTQTESGYLEVKKPSSKSIVVGQEPYYGTSISVKGEETITLYLQAEVSTTTEITETTTTSTETTTASEETTTSETETTTSQ